MEASELERAKAAAVSAATSLGLDVDDAVVLFASNRLALRLTPGDVLARVSSGGHATARLELDRARRLAAAGCPVGVPHPRVPPQVHERDGFALTFWTYHDQTGRDVPAEDYAAALARLHAGLRSVDLPAPRFTDRVEEARQVVSDPDLSPDLADADRVLLVGRLTDLRRRIDGLGTAEQLVHGEPHPGNVLATEQGPVLIDLETLCLGPVELDLAHAPESVCAHYPGLDPELLTACRQLVMAVIAAWRWRVDDDFPDREHWRHALLAALREGSGWPVGPVDPTGFR
ncbi:Phosphotransferase enzyme family protein [Microlunatus sagamiharensis]|uniref:Phosphotransferase enzyme family protein n=1 Tax=Microlunatus sagamiharensis TaxID=546874 RepID=A0A1H2MDA6_9ACTN|nr:aminoglycoside phosphotransferase family protein [Microlunatus sagamiharensis]SDU91054.1 Phosphotransferase enzyme family protein [Microlunatus sagamiharensis]